jgi:hypothetical protein
MPDTVPAAWMPAAAMKRIHVHWTAGGHTANATDKSHYHIIIQGDGTLVRGDKSIAANAAGSGMTPASHTKNANTGAIGMSMCCMAGARENPFNAGNSPMTKVQWDKAMLVAADLARRYSIAVTPVTVLTHAEVGPNLNIPQNGKWDITRLAFDGSISGHKAVGDRMRREIATHLDGSAPAAGPIAPPPEALLPKFKVSGVAPSTLNFRDAPNGTKIGALGEGARVERLGIDGHWWRVRTSGGFVGWVFSDFLKRV